MFKLGSVIYSNVLKGVSSQQGCIYLYRKKTCLIQEGGLKNGQKLCFVGIMSDRMLRNVKCSVNIFKLLFCNLLFYLKSRTKE